MSCPQEIWKPISGYPGYEVSSLGRVRSFKKFVGPVNWWDIAEEPQKILSPSLSPNGYLGVNLSNDGTVEHRRIASLVLEAFVGPRPEGMEICHRDCNKANDRLDNLRYDVHQANSLDGVGRQASTRLTNEQATMVKRLAARGIPDDELAERFGVSTESIRNCRLGYRYAYTEGPITKRPSGGRRPVITDKNIGAKIRAARVQNGKKRGELAREVGITPKWLYRVESGRGYPSKDLAYRIQKATGIQLL